MGEDSVRLDQGRVECLAEDLLRGPVVRTCVECADAVAQGGMDNVVWAEGVRVRIELVVECCGAEEQGWEDGAELRCRGVELLGCGSRCDYHGCGVACSASVKWADGIGDSGIVEGFNWDIGACGCNVGDSFSGVCECMSRVCGRHPAGRSSGLVSVAIVVFGGGLRGIFLSDQSISVLFVSRNGIGYCRVLQRQSCFSSMGKNISRMMCTDAAGGRSVTEEREQHLVSTKIDKDS